jgi:hypothetical protein
MARESSLSEKTWRDDFRGFKLDRLLSFSGDTVTHHFDMLEDGECYQAIRTVDTF